MNLSGKSLIAGRETAPSGKTFHAVDPRTGESIEPEFYEATAIEINLALEAAVSAQAELETRAPSAWAKLLETIASEIEGLGDILLERCSRETALPLARLQSERARTCGQLRLFAELAREGSWVDARIDLALPERTPLPRPDIRRMLKSIGPVAVFGASNFPFAFSVAGGDTASAFAAGCAVIAKGHPAHPGTSELMAKAISQAVELCQFPAGLFSLLQGGRELGAAIVEHPLLAAVGFTGSQAAGRALCNAAAARPQPIPVFAEMSGVNPLVILPGALRERSQSIAQGLVTSVTLGGGQFCTKPGLIFLCKGELTDAFFAQLKETMRSAASATLLSPGIRSAFRMRREAVSSGPGVAVLTLTPEPKEQGPACELASVTTVSARNFLRSPDLAHEVFGPFALIVVADELQELMACCRALEGQLTATVHCAADEQAEARRLFSELEKRAGRLILNGFPTGVEVSPAMHHGGPYPATSDSRFTSVGTAAVYRFARPVCYQSFPDALLPDALKNANPLKIQRLINGQRTSEPIR